MRKSAHNITRPRRGFTIGASPFNGVKLELGLLLVVGVVLVLIHRRIVAGALGQLALLGGYGVVSLLWIVARTRWVLVRHGGARPIAGRKGTPDSRAPRP